MDKVCQTPDGGDGIKKIFLISDLHFDHTNIIRYTNRPFQSTGEMNDALVHNWNSAVGDGDMVYFLGDLVFGRNRHPIDYWLEKLNGEILFIRGNHDTDDITKARVVEDRYLVNYMGCDFLLMHDPYRQPGWNGWIIHGDKHNNDPVGYPHIHKPNKTINVSAELVDYTPISLDEILSRINL